MTRISVIGAGYVGLVTALCFADKGFDTIDFVSLKARMMFRLGGPGGLDPNGTVRDLDSNFAEIGNRLQFVWYTVEKALGALMRFRALCDTMQVERLWVLATAACRDARNGRRRHV